MFKKIFFIMAFGILCNVQLNAAQKSKTQYDAAATNQMWEILDRMVYSSKREEAAQLLKTHLNHRNPDINAKYKGETPLSFLTRLSHTQSMKLFIDSKANINCSADIGGNRPVHSSATCGSVPSMQLLLDANAEINIINESGFTPLMCAAIMGHPEIIRMLVVAQADIAMKDQRTNKTAKDYAKDFGHEKAYLKAVAAGEAELKKIQEKAINT